MPGSSQNCDFVLLSEFDIDKGSTLKHQYPHATGFSPDSLAELMLPAGAHLRGRDSTVFFLRRWLLEAERNAAKSKKLTPFEASRRDLNKIVLNVTSGVRVTRFSDELQNWEPVEENVEQTLRLVRSEEELPECPTARQLSTQYQLEVLSGFAKTETDTVHSDGGDDYVVLFSVPVSEDMEYTKLQDKFSSLWTPQGECLGLLFETPDDAKVVADTVDHVHEWASRWKGRDLSEQEADEPAGLERDVCVCYNIVMTKRDDSVRRGAVVKAMAVCTRHLWYGVFDKLLVRALEQYYVQQDFQVLADLYELLNTGSCGTALANLPWPSQEERDAMRAVTVHPAQRFAAQAMDNYKPRVRTCVCNVGGSEVTLEVPVLLEAETVPDASVATLIDMFGAQTLILWNALLLQKRVFFVGHEKAAEQVAHFVLSACKLVCGPLRGTVLRRAFPNVDLVHIDWLEATEGVIAGVTNPIFRQHERMWDVMADIATGEVVLSAHFEQLQQQADPLERAATLDADFFAEVESGIHLGRDEDWVASRFQAYTKMLLDMALGRTDASRAAIFETPDEGARLWDANSSRIALIMQTDAFLRYQEEQDEEEEHSAFGSSHSDIRQGVRQLQAGCDLPLESLREIYTMLDDVVVSPQHVAQLLRFLSPLTGGIAPIASGVLCADDTVRQRCVRLLRRIRDTSVGECALQSLNYMLLLDFLQQETPGNSNVSPTTTQVSA